MSSGSFEEVQDPDDKEPDIKSEQPERMEEDPAGPPVETEKGVEEEKDENEKDENSSHEEENVLASYIPEIEKADASDSELLKNEPTTPLEEALMEALKRKASHVERLTGEISKLKAFISKRKQTYKRKRKDEGAPTRALSAYNIFVQDRFAQLAKENEKALKSADTDAQLKRVPPANLVASTGNQWKELAPEEKQKYVERAKSDRKRYEDQMAKYQPPDKQANRKRNKTGYNMFFSAHVLHLKQSETGVPSERGSVARLVGTAWKKLSAEEKQYYEREADKHNGMNPVKEDVEDDEDDEAKRQQMGDPYAHMHPGAMHMHEGMHGGAMHHQPPQHDPRHHSYAPYPTHHHHMYGQPYSHYDYGQQHPSQQHHSRHAHQGRSQAYHQQGYPPPQRHPYDQGGMGM